MYYEVKINTPCENEEETAVVIAAALASISNKKGQSKPSIKPIRHTGVNVSPWAMFGRYERMTKKLR